MFHTGPRLDLDLHKNTVLSDNEFSWRYRHSEIWDKLLEQRGATCRGSSLSLGSFVEKWLWLLTVVFARIPLTSAVLRGQIISLNDQSQ